MRKANLSVLFVILISLIGWNLSAQKITYSVEKIWDNGSYAAFTSLIKYKGMYYCSFREGESHIFDKNGNAEGKVRILVSKNGKKWESVALIGKPTYDLRDPKLSVTADDRLMVIIGGSVYKDKVLTAAYPQVVFSSDGKTFTDPQPVNLDKQAYTGRDWIWRVTWDGKTGYGVNYGHHENSDVLFLVSTTDGVNFKTVSKIDVDGFPNETTLRILPDKRMLMMIRRDGNDKMGYWGVSKPPYTNWKLTKMGLRLGGPDFIISNNDVIIAATRSQCIQGSSRTILLKGDLEGHFGETFVLPSGSDCSYPGLLIVGKELWVCYYSSHETEKACIYLAKLPLSLFN